jgi:hypothetical protein
MAHASSLATAIISSQAGLTKLELAARFERMNADQGASIAKLIDSAQQNVKSLANVAAGIGTKLDASA